MQQKKFKKIIRFAINNEAKAQQFYAFVSKKLKDPRLKEMFKQFAMEEANHKAILEQLCDECIYYLSSVKVSDFNISEKVEKPVISSDMKPANAIAVAMKNEE
ncbi:MAG: ferritin family protein, partial [Desulfobacterales bacterium]